MVFNEVMYQPAGNDPALEWVELHNQMAVDMDLSGWSIAGGIEFEFPAGTVLRGGAQLVVAASPTRLAETHGLQGALGPFAGRLANEGERLELLNNNRRVMDVLEYDDAYPWPVGADGGGPSLAKIDPDTASSSARNWTHSRQVGGTPGEENFPEVVDADSAHTPPLSEPYLLLSEVAGAGNPSFWLEINNRGAQPVDLTGFVIGSSDGDAYVFSDGIIGPGEFAVVDRVMAQWGLDPGDRLFLYEPGADRLLDAVVVGNTLQARSTGSDLRWFQPSSPTPAAANQFDLRDEIVINEVMYHHRPTLGSPESTDTELLVPVDSVWKYEQSGMDLGNDWRTAAYDDSSWSAGKGAFFVETADLPAPKNTPLEIGQTTYYFRHKFQFSSETAATRLTIRPIVDDGAVFYLNGVEVYRHNMPTEEIGHSTLAASTIRNAVFSDTVTIPMEYVAVGTNVLAVEVHQGDVSSDDIVFGAELSVVVPVPAEPFQESTEEWIEFYNRGTGPADMSGWKLAGGVDYSFPPGTILQPGQYLVIANDAARLAAMYPGIRVQGNFAGRLDNKSDRIELVDRRGNLVDEVQYYDGGRWPQAADGGGSSLELRSPDADNSVAEAWAASDERERSQWHTYTYRGIVQTFVPGSPAERREFDLGVLAGPGELLLDDVHVIEVPSGRATELIENGSFEQGDALWRYRGNHRHSRVIADPDDPQNKVLHVVATGPTEYQGNQIETTLVRGSSIVEGREYEISFRAKWLSGSPKLNTRLYFNRLPRTTHLKIPDQSGTPGARNSTYQPNAGPVYHDFHHDPVVPAPDEPVVVRVRAEDPEGVRSLMLWWSVNNSAWRSVPMAAGDSGFYSGTIPGQSPRSVVHFYVEGEDGRGALSTFPAAGRDARALYTVQDGRADLAKLHNLRIIMTPADAAFLHQSSNVLSNERLGATVVYDERTVYYDVGVRLKGSAVGRDVPRVGFNLRFHPDRRFRGVHETVSIDRSAHTAIGTSEILVKHIANHAGDIPGMYDDLVRVIAPRDQQTGAALLQMGRYEDVYLDSQFDNGSDGAMFELEGYRSSGYLDVPFRDYGDDKEAYRWHLLIANNRTRDDYRGMIALSKALSRPANELAQALPEVIDVDQWMRAVALHSLAQVGDAFPSEDHNVRFYVRPGDQRVLLFPWDWDQLLSGSTDGGLSAGLLSPVAAIGQNRRLLEGHALDIIQTTFNPTYMRRWLEHYGNLGGQNYASMLRFIDLRSSAVLRSLPAKIPFAITTNGGNPFSVDAEAVTIAGRGWIDVRQIRLAGQDQPLDVTWLDHDRWQVTIPIQFGANMLAIEAYDHQNRLVGSDQLTVTSTIRQRALQQFLRITEIHYNPTQPDDATEFIELQNISSGRNAVTLDLAGARIVDGFNTPFLFSDGDVTTLAPGQYLLLVRNRQAFLAAYPRVDPARIAGEYDGALDNRGEQLHLVDAHGATIMRFRYEDNEPGWYAETDGGGRSLVIASVLAAADWNLATSWRASYRIGGSPAADDNPWPGDANFDGVFDTSDLVAVFQVGEYEDAITGNSTWAEGDWNGDGEFDTADLVAAFQAGGYADAIAAANPFRTPF